MGAEGRPSLSEILASIEFILREPLDFSATDPETTAAKVRLLTAAAHYFNTLAVADFGG